MKLSDHSKILLGVITNIAKHRELRRPQELTATKMGLNLDQKQHGQRHCRSQRIIWRNAGQKAAIQRALRA